MQVLQTNQGNVAEKEPEGVLVGDWRGVSEERQRQMDEQREIRKQRGESDRVRNCWNEI